MNTGLLKEGPRISWPPRTHHPVRHTWRGGASLSSLETQSSAEDATQTKGGFGKGDHRDPGTLKTGHVPSKGASVRPIHSVGPRDKHVPSKREPSGHSSSDADQQVSRTWRRVCQIAPCQMGTKVTWNNICWRPVRDHQTWKVCVVSDQGGAEQQPLPLRPNFSSSRVPME